jgi:hypothetical protein
MARYLKRNDTRRRFLGLSGTVFLSRLSHAISGFLPSATRIGNICAVQMAIERMVGSHARANPFGALPQRRNGTLPHLRISRQHSCRRLFTILFADGSELVPEYVPGVSTSLSGDCLNMLPGTLPGISAPVLSMANVPHRFALNDTNDGYTAPNWSWEQWERQIDVLALHGINEVHVYIGADAVYQQTFRKFDVSDQQLRQWFSIPAHQPRGCCRRTRQVGLVHRSRSTSSTRDFASWYTGRASEELKEVRQVWQRVAQH